MYRRDHFETLRLNDVAPIVSTPHRAIALQIVPVFCLVAAALILPFAAMRLMGSEWLIGIIDLVGVVMLLGGGWYVRRFGDLRRAGYVLATLCFTWITFLVHRQGVTMAYWVFPTMVATYFVFAPPIALAFDAVAAVALVLVYPEPFGVHLATFVAAMVLTPLFVYFFANRANLQALELERLSLTDSLTGAGNRRALDVRLSEVLALQQRSTEPTALLVLDCDGFKDINDSHGHAAGDRVLIGLGVLIRSHIRACDGFYRFGGDEFVVVAPATNEQNALILAEKLRKLVELDASGGEVVLTVTVGVAGFSAGESVAGLMKRVDDALIAGKRSGRNCVHLAHAVDSGDTWLPGFGSAVA